MESYPNVAYTPDLNPYDFFLLSQLKYQLHEIGSNADNIMVHLFKQAISGLRKDGLKNDFNDQV